jgi:hypothetical protein
MMEHAARGASLVLPLALHVHGTEPLVVVHFHQNRRATTKANWSQLESEFAETFLHRALLTAGG